MRSFLILTSDDVANAKRYIVISQSISVDLVPYSIRTKVFFSQNYSRGKKKHPSPFYKLAAQGRLELSRDHSNASIFNMTNDTDRIGPLKKFSMS